MKRQLQPRTERFVGIFLPLLALAALLTSQTTLAQTPGQLDPTFNTTGINITDLSNDNNYDAGHTVMLNSDGYVVIGGANIGNVRQVALAKYSNDGLLTETFYSNSDTNQFTTSALANLVIGFTTEGVGLVQKWSILSFNPDLTLNTNFGTNGIARFTINETSTYSLPHSISAKDGFFHPITQLPETRYVIAGQCGEYAAVVRIRRGAPVLDNTFSGDGKMLVDIPGMIDEQARGVAIGDDGMILITGFGTSSNPIGGNKKGFIAKLNNTGLEGNWGNNGVVEFSVLTNGSTVPPTLVSNTTFLQAITLDYLGRILVCGQIRNDNSAESKFFVARRNADGSADTSFGTSNGYTIIDFVGTESHRNSGANAMAIQPDGRIVVVGYSRRGFPNDQERVALARLEEDGTMDMSFGLGGITETDVPGLMENAESVIITDYRIVVAGWVELDDSSISSDFLILRYLTGSYVGTLELTTKFVEPLVFPNPITESTTFTYTLAESERLTITLQDLQGKQLTTFMDGELLPAGEHRQVVSIPPDLASGNYLLVFSSPSGKTGIQVTK